MRQLDPQDATFLYLEGLNRATHASCVWLYDPGKAAHGPVVLEELASHIEARLDVAKLLTQKLVRVPLDLDYPYWVDDPQFQLADHLHQVTLRAPGDWAGFCSTVAAIHSRPLDLGRPLWEIHLIQGLKGPGLPEGAFALLMKLHHVALDGATGMKLLQGLHDPDPEPLSRHAARREKRSAERAPQPLVMLAAAARNNMAFATRGARALARLVGRLPHVLSTVRVRTLLNASDAPLTIFNQGIAAERSFGLASVDLEQVKQLRLAVPGSTVNDVLLTICAGALRRFLESKAALPDGSMAAVCPINVRTADEADRGGNRIAAMVTRIHTEIADPLERLRAVHRSTRRSKRIVGAVGAREMLELNNSLPSPAQALFIGLVDRLPGLSRLPRIFNVPISNLPGLHRTLYLGGARLLEIGGAMPVGNGYGLFIAICSYDGKVSFSVTSARNILPDPEQLMVHFGHALAELRHAAALHGVPSLQALGSRVASRSTEAS